MTWKISILLGLGSIAVTPWWTYDPINPVKFVFLCMAGCTSLTYLFLNKIFFSISKVLLIGSAAFVLQIVFSLMFSGVNITYGLFGAYGRLFGAVTWIMMLAIFLFYSAIQPQEHLLKIFVGVGGISLVYSVFQLLGIDPAPWNNDYDPVIGFLGNPNFQSSFLGLFFIAVVGKIIQKQSSNWSIFFWSFLALIDLFAIYRTNSIQGFFVVLVGLTSFLAYILHFKNYRYLLFTFFTTGIVSTALFVMAVFGMGPLQSLLYKGTLAIRGDFWVTALLMTKSAPFTGVGPDNYGENYRLFRPIESLTRINSEVTSDSAHNVYLDFSANLGVVSLCIYLFFALLVLRKVSHFVRNSITLNCSHLIVTAIWVAFNGQLLISPNQIGLVLWGWAFAGLLLSYSNSQDNLSNYGLKQSIKEKKKALSKISPTSSSDLISWLAGAMIGLLISLPIYISSVQFRSALVSANALRISSSAQDWPRNPTTMLYAARIMFDNNLMEQGLQLTNLGIKEYPNSFALWREKLRYNKLTKEEIILIKLKLVELDPLNSSLR